MESMRVSSTDIKLRPVVHHPRGYPIEEDLFLQAVRAGKYRLVTQILNIHTEIDINQVDKQGRTALLMSVQLADYEIRTHLVKLLLKHNADVNKADREGMTPLMHACQCADKVDTVRSLIKQPSCAINQQDNHGNTALNWAVSGDNWRAVRAIVNCKYTKSNVNLWNEDRQGLSPLEYAIDNNYTETCWVLLGEARLDPSKLTISYRNKLEKISQTFPEVYTLKSADSNNNSVERQEVQQLSSNRAKLMLTSPAHSTNTSTAMLTPIDGDVSSVPALTPIDGDMGYNRQLPKLPAISHTNHS